MPLNYPGRPPQIRLPQDGEAADAESVNRPLRDAETAMRARQHLPFMELGLDSDEDDNVCSYRVGGPDFVIARDNGDAYVSNGTVRENGITQNIDDWDFLAHPDIGIARVNAVAASPTKIIAVGSLGLILTDDTSWHEIEPGSSYNGTFRDVAYAPNNGRFVAVGSLGEIQSENGSFAFISRLALGSGYNFTDIAIYDDRDGRDFLFAAGNGPDSVGIIYHSRTATGWEQVGEEGDFPHAFQGLCTSEDGRVFALYLHQGTGNYHIAWCASASDADEFDNWTDEDTGISSSDYFLTDMCHVTHSDLLCLAGCAGAGSPGFPGVVLLGNVGGRRWIPCRAPQFELYGAAPPGSPTSRTIKSVISNGRRILAVGEYGAGFYTNGAVLREPIGGHG